MSERRRTGRICGPSMLALLPAVTLAVALGGCGGGGGGGGTRPADPVSRLEFEGLPAGTLDLNAGASQVVTVEAVDADGDEVEDAAITATSSNTGVATVAAGTAASRIRLAATDFTIRGVAPGTANVAFRHAPTSTTRDLTVSVATAPAPPPPGPAPPPPPPPPPPGDVVILTGNGSQSFVRGSVVNGTVTIARGQRVVWDWNDPAPHSTTSDSGVWNSGVLTGTSQSFAFTFTNAGTFPYHCTVHGSVGGIGMSGTIVVTP